MKEKWGETGEYRTQNGNKRRNKERKGHKRRRKGKKSREKEKERKDGKKRTVEELNTPAEDRHHQKNSAILLLSWNMPPRKQIKLSVPVYTIQTRSSSKVLIILHPFSFPHMIFSSLSSTKFSCACRLYSSPSSSATLGSVRCSLLVLFFSRK